MKKDLKILVVDDFSTMRRIIRNLLRDLGFPNVEEAENGSVALIKMRSMNGKYDLLVADLNMPVMDGLTMVREMRGDEKLNRIPVIVVTAEARRELIVEAANAGVNAYIVKPFTANTLKEKIGKVLGEAID